MSRAPRQKLKCTGCVGTSKPRGDENRWAGVLGHPTGPSTNTVMMTRCGDANPKWAEGANPGLPEGVMAQTAVGCSRQVQQLVCQGSCQNEPEPGRGVGFEKGCDLHNMSVAVTTPPTLCTTQRHCYHCVTPHMVLGRCLTKHCRGTRSTDHVMHQCSQK